MEKKRTVLKILATLLILPLPILTADENQFTIIAGKQASTSETVMMAHNEGTTKENAFVNIHKISPRTYSQHHQIKLKHNTTIPQTRQTLGLHL